MSQPNPTEHTPTPVPVETKVIQPNPPAPGTVEPTFPASHVHELREEAAGWRKKFREAEAQIKELAPLKDELPKLQGQVREMQIGTALADAISKAGANAKLTRALLRDEISALDPSKDDFGKSLTAMVEKAIKDNPELKAAAAGTPPPPAKAGSDITHPNTTTPVATDQLSRADLARMKAAGDHEGIAKAMKEGKFRDVMAGKA